MAVNVQNYKKLTGKGTGEAKEYTVAEIADLYHPNLLVNGDFRINKRGFAVYDGFGYGLDMWHFSATNANTINPINNGGLLIKRTTGSQNVIRQYLTSINISDIGKKYTLCFDFESNVNFVNTIGFGNQREKILISAGIKRYHHTFVLNSEDIKNNNVDILIFNIEQNIAGFELKIHNADLFDGDIAYRHQKEDSAIAFSRCQRFTKEIEINSSNYLAGSSEIKDTINFCMEMNSSPTFKIIDAGTRQNVSSVGIFVNNKRLIYSIVSTGGGQVALTGYKLFLTCEPI